MSTPQYQVIRAEIEAKISRGVLAPGQKLPSEAELQKKHSVSRSVAQRVLNDLADAGLVIRRKGSGTRVAEGARQINVMRSVDPRIGMADVPGQMHVAAIETIPAAEAAVHLPGLADDEPVHQLTRVRRDTVTGTPTSVEIAAIPFRISPNLPAEDLQSVAIRAHLAALGVEISVSRMYFDPVALTSEVAALLETEPHVPTLRRRRVMWRSNGDVAESTAYYLKPGAMEFYIEYSDQESLDVSE
ncbi:GntR family transcriptional regulator [Brevibacterium sp. S111]|uniref:GntR family transcriptional regulator n=1 Tax=Brevibacterium sp. S111 TaxID=2483795 RepID=UPI0014368E3E|nr:GntR family transcriptional regulator [Brevibacterium sp. S111]